jgi:hypothetical protein
MTSAKAEEIDLIIYTCVTGNYDWVFSPIWQQEGVKYICFTDNRRMKDPAWDFREIPKECHGFDNSTVNRFCKFFPWKILPPHTWSIYIDANVRLLSDPRPLIKMVEKTGVSIAIPRHPTRSDPWQEGLACVKRKKIQGEMLSILESQLKRYEESGLKQNCGLTENNVIIRTGTEYYLNNTMQLWWNEFTSGVARDQISLPFVLFKSETNIFRIPFSTREENPYFRVTPHRRKWSIGRYIKARRFQPGVAQRSLNFFFRKFR